MSDIKDCFACGYYDSSVDACNCDDKCYIDGAREFAKFLIDKGIDVVDLHAEFQEGRINND